ncbi:cytochrome c3 family protein [Kosmotoga pacifica]|uniref:Uncharacterized protein n=1 Tax=Kosmotoga pacifica TaxID=1330330 RepID=A0A0G2ZC37_9BACT|nr:cytochrome c3 family protein [Kosmotoga pacifica]AKI97646.1 hypothetical protein IX53_07265 [Kosmotoga pacifica]
MNKYMRVFMAILLAVVVAGFVFLGNTLIAADETTQEEEDILHADQRGCTSCHRVVTFPDGSVHDYTLYAEVQNIEDHPSLKKSKVESMGVEYCLLCHEDGKYAFEKILHPIHLFSEHFTGNCFSCHDIEGGEFVLWEGE